MNYHHTVSPQINIFLKKRKKLFKISCMLMLLIVIVMALAMWLSVLLVLFQFCNNKCYLPVFISLKYTTTPYTLHFDKCITNSMQFFILIWFRNIFLRLEISLKFQLHRHHPDQNCLHSVKTSSSKSKPDCQRFCINNLVRSTNGDKNPTRTKIIASTFNMFPFVILLQ